MARKASSRANEYGKRALLLHKKLGGKLEIVSKRTLKSRDDWSLMYTPGVGAVSSFLAKNPKEARRYTMKRTTVAVVSDGSAVLGLGNIGPLAALPVMEGKCAILKEMAGIDGMPLVLDTQDTEEIIQTIKHIAPGLGGINLEDISAPRCFEIEERLKEELDIPVMHDDQHGTAIVVLAGLINASKVVKKRLEDLKLVVVGAGAAGRAIALLLLKAGVRDVIVTDSKGILHIDRTDLVPYKKELALATNPRRISGTVAEAAHGADAIIGVSGPGTITAAHVRGMAQNAIVFALANPVPEITIAEAAEAGAGIIATGRSDYPNQVNNALAFPGIFKGALERGVTKITDDMKLKVARKIASLVKSPRADAIVPKVTMPGLAKAVASAIR
jgi:malate dehydrogenase (oxaloacetate-decarboxylating)